MKYLKIIWISLLSCLIWIFIGYLLFSKSNSISKNDIFENSKNCQTYLEDFKKKGFSDNDYNHAIFYSPKENTCIWIYRSIYWNWESLSLKIEDIFNSNENYSYYLRENGSGSLINSLFQKKRCSDLDDDSKNCNIDDYEELVKMRNNEIEWLKWN